VAGALKALREAKVHEQFDLVSISGASGGAVCAALLWFALEKNETPTWGRLMGFWRDNTAQRWLEQAFNQLVVGSIRLANRGLLPTPTAQPHLAIRQPPLQQGSAKPSAIFAHWWNRTLTSKKWRRGDHAPRLRS
jgi:NTE family protein